MFASVVLSVTLVSVHAFTAHRPLWTYHGPTGPAHWSRLEGSHCAGPSQSPIDINTQDAIAKTGKLTFHGYNLKEEDAGHPVDIINNGHSAQVNLAGNYLIKGGGLSSTYKAVQFHFHWGSHNDLGSEHAVNGAKHPAEMHIVHYDYINYGNLSEAIASQQPGAVAVVAVFLKVGGEDNSHYDQLMKSLSDVAYEGEEAYVEPFNLLNLLPSNIDRFYRYEGSLTTPNCDPDVSWTIMEEAVSISQTQLDTFRSLYSTLESETPAEHLVDNFRPLQPLEGRQVYLYSPETYAYKWHKVLTIISFTDDW